MWETFGEYSFNDPDAGIITYDYNAFGELITQTDAVNSYEISYDRLGRIDYKNGPEGTYDYAYNATGNGKGLLNKITGPNNICDSYECLNPLTM